MSRIQTGRDPFARHTVRKSWTVQRCQWCGSNHKPARMRFAGSWLYVVDADSPRDSGTLGAFCGLDCLNAFHGSN